jgi:hypothetical protein
MSPKERVEKVLRRQKVDFVPFTVYEGMLPQCETERKLRNNGLCILQRVSVFNTVTPDVKEKTIHYSENGESKIRTDCETPYGKLYTVRNVIKMDAPPGATTWASEKIFKTPDDYKAIEFLIKNRKHSAYYDDVVRWIKMAGEDITFRAGISYEPLQDIIYTIMGVENFSIEWSENRDEVLRLYHTLVEDRRKIYPLVADSPVLHINYGGNIMADTIGLDRFEKYILPDYQEAAEIIHKKGKLLGSHLDGNNKLIAELVAKSPLDYIEAFTPSPDTDMTLKEAMEIWKDKILWINFPSSVHLKSEEEIKKTTEELLKEAGENKNRLIVGITENVPYDKWEKSFSTILDTLRTSSFL